MSRVTVGAAVLAFVIQSASASAQSWEVSGLAAYTPSAGLEHQAPELSGLDVRGTQFGHGTRGIGAYVYNMLDGLLAAAPGHEYLLLALPDLPLPPRLRKRRPRAQQRRAGVVGHPAPKAAGPRSSRNASAATT